MTGGISTMSDDDLTRWERATLTLAMRFDRYRLGHDPATSLVVSCIRTYGPEQARELLAPMIDHMRIVIAPPTTHQTERHNR